ncbi:MAG: DUF2997 domain-containing protein [Planctomycetaceae bacterium]|nr:DUF2997 domain-containing protein [Planctomycetaceae bacterium]
MNQVIEITVAANGATTVETKGFVGSECRRASQFIEAALGQREEEVLKAEFHHGVDAASQVRQAE